MLTNAAVKAARPRAAGYKLADERGLHLYVASNGRRSFRWRFRVDGKEQLLTIGEWPAVTLEAIGRRWHAHMQPRWTDVHASDVLASLERDVFPAIGAMPLPAITAPVVLNALRGVEQRGRYETARRRRFGMRTASSRSPSCAWRRSAARAGRRSRTSTGRRRRGGYQPRA